MTFEPKYGKPTGWTSENEDSATGGNDGSEVEMSPEEIYESRGYGPAPDWVRKKREETEEIDEYEEEAEQPKLPPSQKLEGPEFPTLMKLGPPMYRSEDVKPIIFPRSKLVEEASFIPLFKRWKEKTIDRPAKIRRMEPAYANHSGLPMIRGEDAIPYWNLVTYRREAINEKTEEYKYSEQYAVTVHGVAVPLGNGKIQPFQMRIQIDSAIQAMKIPPFQMWVHDPSGGDHHWFYGIILFDRPLTPEEAKPQWEMVQRFYNRRLTHLGTTQRDCKITDPLPAPGTGHAIYYLSQVKPTSLKEIQRWFRAHPDPSDLCLTSPYSPHFNREQFDQVLEIQAQKEPLIKRRGPRKQKSYTAPWDNWVRFIPARLKEMEQWLDAQKRVADPYQFLMDYAAGVKRYEWAGGMDSYMAFKAAWEQTDALNQKLQPDQRFSGEALEKIVRASDPTNPLKKAQDLVLDLGITREIALELGFKHLCPRDMKAEQIIEREATDLERRKKKKEKEQEDLQTCLMIITRLKLLLAGWGKEKSTEKEEARKARQAEANRKKEEASVRAVRNQKIKDLIHKHEETGVIAQIMNVDPKTVSRLADELRAAGFVVEQKKGKPGRKKNTGQPPPSSGPANGLPQELKMRLTPTRVFHLSCIAEPLTIVPCISEGISTPFPSMKTQF